MDARSALFDLYGDHLRPRGGAAPVAALVRLLGTLGVAAPAVRTAVSRMVRQGWLLPARVDGAPGYAMTATAQQRLDEAAVRIYRTDLGTWDGTWHLLVLTAPLRSGARGRVVRGLRFLGYAPLGDRAWLAVRRSSEVDPLLRRDGVRAESFRAEHLGDPHTLAARAWDLDTLASAYAGWQQRAGALLDGAASTDSVAPAGQHVPVAADGGAASLGRSAGRDGSEPVSDATAFAARSRLVHEWRKFLFTDPGLPRALLPQEWPGDTAAALFDREERRLAPAAARYVDACLRGGADGSPS